MRDFFMRHRAARRTLEKLIDYLLEGSLRKLYRNGYRWLGRNHEGIRGEVYAFKHKPHRTEEIAFWMRDTYEKNENVRLGDRKKRVFPEVTAEDAEPTSIAQLFAEKFDKDLRNG